MLARVALALVATVSSVARADIESPLVKRGVQAYAELDYAKAIALLEQARKESLTREEKIVTLQTLGLACVALGQPAEARGHFGKLLRIDPSFQLDRSVAPKVRAVFEEAKAQAATAARGLSPGLPTVTPELSPASIDEGRALTVRVSYPGGVAQKMALYHRTAGQPSFSRILVGGSDGRFETTVPGMGVQAPALEYHVALLDQEGAAIASAGTLGQPISVAVSKRRRPVYTRGWFWGVVGGVAAAGALAAVLAVVIPRPNTASVTVIPQ